MQFILLAGGLSSRLWPIPDKNLLSICGRSLVRRRAEGLYSLGFKSGVVVVSPENKLSIAAELKGLDLKLSYVEQPEACGMADAVLRTKPYLNTKQELFILSVNDLVERAAFDLLLEAVENNKKIDSFILAKKCENYFPGGYLKLDEEEFVIDIIEKPEPAKCPSKFINLVVHYFKDWEKFYVILAETSSPRDDVYEVALKKFCNEARVQAVKYNGFWQALKYPWHVLAMMNYFLKNSEARIDPSARISDKATIKGHVIIEEGVKVFENAVVRGPAYIGRNAVVANNALVRDSHVGTESVVGYNTEIARSYLGSKVWTHSNYIGDSVIMDNCSFGAGAITGNLRLDEGEISSVIKEESINTGMTKLGLMMGFGCRVGINTNFMPGIKVGSNCSLASGLNVAKDVPDNTFLAVRQEYVVRKNRVDKISDRLELKGKI